MKKLFALLLCICLMIPLAACTENPTPSTDTGSTAPSDTSASQSGSTTQTDTSSDTGSENPDQPKDSPNLVMATDFNSNRIVIYDMDLLEPGVSLDLAEVWSTNSLGIAVNAGLKYREDTVFGDVIVLALGWIISYPEGEILAKTNHFGTNPHSVEILPSGNLVLADACEGVGLRLYYTCKYVDETSGNTQICQYKEYDLTGAHGVLWDPEYEVLWALGDSYLKAYEVVGEGENETLVEIPDMGIQLPGNSKLGHDLSADFSSKDHLYITTAENVFRFDKKTNELSSELARVGSSKLDRENVKGFGNNANGNFFFCFPNGGEGTNWEKKSFAYTCTDTIYFCYWKNSNFLVSQAYVSEKSAFYKVRVFDGRYQ